MLQVRYRIAADLRTGSVVLVGSVLEHFVLVAKDIVLHVVLFRLSRCQDERLHKATHLIAIVRQFTGDLRERSLASRCSFPPHGHLHLYDDAKTNRWMRVNLSNLCVAFA